MSTETETKATFTKGGTVYILCRCHLLKFGSSYAVSLWKSKAYFFVGRKKHFTILAAHYDNSSDKVSTSIAEIILKAWEQSKGLFYMYIMYVKYIYISIEITPFQLPEMSQGKPTSGECFLF